MGFGRFLITQFDGCARGTLAKRAQRVLSGGFLGETEGPFLGADLRPGPPGAQAGARRLRVVDFGVDL